ncbi:replication-associated recombination protein A [Rubrivivax gelatinosus]|uniref:Replication-associated recombination protein A n=1 Tax=Rubrivivax gelatinosus TaxID=28068 RepID=A0A4R2M965_RUBGE|nr:replication-associated recombination protein A [Rubrivivax gelatinosus]MBK1689697.1 recombination factor protein RarA [Rubrivivax gelatinosus]TCP03869.1 recombination protein MgsA [Rubrivivax gelatinosus]
MDAQDSLFADEPPPPRQSAAAQPGAPLAERLRPRTLAEVIGQQHLLGPGRPLRVAFESGRIPSMILWGPPGVGKTTLARLVAGTVDAQFLVLSAVLAGVKDIREAVEQAKDARRRGQATIVFVDEVHRFNKAQQDAFLPHVESGLFTFIGATTENPSFEVNSALLSRATVHVLKPLADEDLGTLLDRARTLLGAPPLTDAARARLVAHADGDARRLLNAYENLVATAGDVAELDEAALERALGELLRRYDKGGDQFFDTISALHKSVRGSDPDAAIYWLARLLDGGADPRYAARRIVRMAAEDIGLADPRALRLALDAAEVYERLGSPEGELALAEAVVYLAITPKSNAVYKAWNEVRALVRSDVSRPVPDHLRNAPTQLMKSLGHGRDYRYAHDEPEGYAAGERYLPDGLVGRRFYAPAGRGLEARIADRLAELRALDDAATTSD